MAPFVLGRVATPGHFALGVRVSHRHCHPGVVIAGLGSDYDVLYDERTLSAFESFLIEITGSAMVRLGWSNDQGSGFRSTLLEDLLYDLKILARHTSGFSVAAHCLCRVE